VTGEKQADRGREHADLKHDAIACPAPCKSETQVRLEEELERLKRVSELGQGLRVLWIPRLDRSLSGEVKNDLIYVYEMDESKSVETLQHEFLDYCLVQAIEPYKEIANSLIRMINDDVYRRKEKIVEALVKFLSRDS